MNLHNFLIPGQVFKLEGNLHEVDYVNPSGRLVMCYVLDKKGRRIFDPEDLIGEDYVKEVFSDLRYYREYPLIEEDDLL